MNKSKAHLPLSNSSHYASQIESVAKMDSSNSTHNVQCISSAFCNVIIVITCIAFPLHILMIKVLFVDLQLVLPRHKIVFCLSISDALQIALSFLCTTVVQISSVTVESGSCHVIKCFTIFNITVTIVVSSLSISLLSAERYVACIHSFRLHELFTRERTRYSISCIWVIGVICGSLAAAAAVIHGQIMFPSPNDFVDTFVVIIVLPTSIFLTFIQYRLLVFSRKKLARVKQGSVFGCNAEIADLRRKQIKIAFVAAIVVIAHVLCMLPLSVLSIYEMINGPVSSAPVRGIARALAVLNNFADPFIYGIGIADSRKALLKNLKKLKSSLEGNL